MFRPDVVCIGALNVDLILSASQLRDLDPTAVTEGMDQFERNRERPSTTEEIEDIVTNLGRSHTRTSLGGSAFLTATSLAKLGLSLRIGYIGVEGKVDRFADIQSFTERLDELEIDHRLVQASSEDAGLCLSIVQAGERSLLTAPNANLGISQHFSKQHDKVVGYLANSRYIHVTSLFDDESARDLAAILAEVKDESPFTRISFDPGYHWCNDPPPAFEELLRLTDFLLVNESELDALAQRLSGPTVLLTDKARAAVILHKCDDRGMLLALKNYDRIVIFFRVDGDVRTEEFKQVPLPELAIEDATGAGDVFAAGLLAALASKTVQVQFGSLLGMALAKAKLGAVGPPERAKLERLGRQFARQLEKEILETSASKRVFISHGGSPDWRKVKKFLEQRGVVVECFERKPRFGLNPLAEVRAMVRSCGAAVVVLSGEDEVNGRKTARPNVWHELGMCHLNYSPERTVILHDRSVPLPSNFRDVIVLRYDAGRLDDTTLDGLFDYLKEELTL